MSTRAREILVLFGFLLVSFLPSLSGLVSMPGEWYAQLDKPSWTPPSWLFGPAWTTLYALMGVAAWLVWKRRGFRDARGAFTLFGVQLVLNAAWSRLFFGLERPDLALAEIVLLWLAIVATLAAFARHHRIAAALLVPYVGWVSFATALNFAIWRLN